MYSGTGIHELRVCVYEVPTDEPESDGTFAWDSTTLVVVRVRSGAVWGLGFTYAPEAAANLIRHHLCEVVLARDALDVPGTWQAMLRQVRNIGRPGVASMAMAAVDTALWDLKARLLNVPLAQLLGRAQETVAVYGSGGFTSYSEDRLQRQLAGWVEQGLKRVKIKIGRSPSEDLRRVRLARDAIGEDTELFVDANGAYDRKQALRFAQEFAQLGVTWFEEPVSSDDREGLRLLRDRAPAGMDISAGEYGYSVFYFRDMLAAGAVDVLQADVTRVAGITEFLRVGALCFAHNTPLSAHTAPALSLHVCTALPGLRHLEYFHDHVRIEQLLFDGVRTPLDGALSPDLSQPGHGLSLKERHVRRFLVHQHDAHADSPRR
ncbi:enolase C-terminal domain-like protein [Deinococcus peraridilitoris]|uniref:Enolase superfamily enzyme related to L-alanine-DL-glutamate epimerase n=1 Tax=Deinococcus peraridilitoris (strain DSM 19664 / LMG 22246 / CIP 109416 / KR-200) TaxID=937777 RepID=L0A779_DEIPD|nr:enolase C-terminal domain-like protein [Deinococcus peraridilitoris]AFZ69304.1 enolase superfamily enzyme related to L-alanine-DL-glutamate epimerase [Deinococcus peraridilitoris DSM 19664]